MINPYVAKILLAIQEGDSVTDISRKTGISYGYTHEWIEQLEEIDIIQRSDGVQIEDEEFSEVFEEAAKTVLARDLDLNDAYLLPNFAGLEYRYSRTDAVFIWTEGGYQIGRNQHDYPIFIDILEDDVDQWTQFFDQYSIDYSFEERIEDGKPGIYYVLFTQDSFESEWRENASVTPLDETVEWAQRYEVNFQPALEMLDEKYSLDLGVQYREREAI